MPVRSKVAVLTLAFLAVLLGPPAPRVETAVSTTLQQALDVPVAQALRVSSALGVHIVDLASGETVYGYNADEARVIASNAKLFTTAAILDALGPGHTFDTRFLLSGAVKDGVLNGALGVVGSGDPQISGRDNGGDSYAAFRVWAQALRERGIAKVAGDIYLDHGLFETLRVHPDWPRDQLTRWYEAPVSGLSFNDNCILVRVWPGRVGQPARVELKPDVQVVNLRNTSRTIAKGGQSVIIHRDGGDLFVKGTIRSNSGPVETWVTIPDPVLYFGKGLVAALAEEGITVEGKLVPVDRLPSRVWERVAVNSSDLVSAIRVTNKRSQNFYAESLAKHLGAMRCGHGSWEDGVRAIREFAVGIGIPKGTFSMSDGSGMSRENRFAPRHLTILLRYMYLHDSAAEFAQSLPYAGENMGSWKRRMAAPPYRGNVLAKTGTLEGVSALSGYAKGVSGKSYAFSILLNRVAGDAHSAQNRIVETLVDNG